MLHIQVNKPIFFIPLISPSENIRVDLEIIVSSEMIPQLFCGSLIRASDRLRQKKGNFAAFSREIMRQKRSIMRQIMRLF